MDSDQLLFLERVLKPRDNTIVFRWVGGEEDVSDSINVIRSLASIDVSGYSRLEQDCLLHYFEDRLEALLNLLSSDLPLLDLSNIGGTYWERLACEEQLLGLRPMPDRDETLKERAAMELRSCYSVGRIQALMIKRANNGRKRQNI